MDDAHDAEIQVTVTHVDGATVVAVDGELDAASTPALSGPLSAAVAEGGAVVLDLSSVGFVDSTGLHAIIDARSEADERGGRLELCCEADGPVARVIEVALPGMIELHPDRESALAAAGD
ncbi:MAG: STAS domain-containing protein [Solirubrobacteraceae bacterium]|nr:STAS domain-containing protein [Solirubrobacteraceae bacterium]